MSFDQEILISKLTHFISIHADANNIRYKQYYVNFQLYTMDDNGACARDMRMVDGVDNRG